MGMGLIFGQTLRGVTMLSLNAGDICTLCKTTYKQNKMPVCTYLSETICKKMRVLDQ